MILFQTLMNVVTMLVHALKMLIVLTKKELISVYVIQDLLEMEHYPALVSFQKKIKFKSLLYSLNTLSGVTSERCPSPRLCARADTSRL